MALVGHCQAAQSSLANFHLCFVLGSHAPWRGLVNLHVFRVFYERITELGSQLAMSAPSYKESSVLT